MDLTSAFCCLEIINKNPLKTHQS